MNATQSRFHNARELSQEVQGTLVAAASSIRVEGLADDSRRVQPGDVFFARRGTVVDGARFARDAVERGAVLVVTEAPVDGIPCLHVADVSQALEHAADLWYGRPQDALDLIGITGTKGKTTTSYLTRAALAGAGRRAGLIGTIAYDLLDGPAEPAPNTTPGLLDMRRLLARARDAGADAVVMEVSSHALDQERVRGLAYRVAVFTNLASDHLDYHGDLGAYFEAKARLFDGLGASGTAVLNREDPAWIRIANRCGARVLTYGGMPEADLFAADLRLGLDQTKLRLVVGGESEIDLSTALVGRHNVLNLLAAVGGAWGLGLDPVLAAEGAAQVQGVPGRLERVTTSDVRADLHVFVDYAHTEDALRQVLSFLRSVGASPLTVVVGCGGDRDRSKRPRMGRVAVELADRAVFTSDNPRGERPEDILDDMQADLPERSAAETLNVGEVVRVVDRRDAIRHAIRTAPPGSTVLVAGKGHETYQILGTAKVPFDDAHEIREALSIREREPGEPPPWGQPQA